MPSLVLRPLAVAGMLLLLFAATAATSASDAVRVDEMSLQDVTARLIAPLQQGEFVQHKQLTNLPLPLTSSGHFAIAPQLLLWTTTEPFVSQLRFDNSGVSQWEDGVQVWQMSAADQPMVATLGNLLTAIVAADWLQLQQTFQLESASPVGEQCWQAVFKTQQNILARVIDQLQLSGCSAVESVILSERNGDITRIQLSAVGE